MNAHVSVIERPERLRLCVADFELLADGGAFADYGKTELIDGDIYVVNAQMTRHARVKMRLTFALNDQLKNLGSDLEILTDISVRVADDSMPEPDIVLTRFRGDRWMPADSVALVVEVAGTTLSTDLGRKAELYAAAGVPEYWVVDLDGGRVVRHARPGADGYAERSQTPFGQPLASTTIDGLEIETADLLG